MKKLRKLFILTALSAAAMITTGCFFGTNMTKTVTPAIRAIGIPDAAAVDSITLTATDASGEIIGETTLSSLTTVPSQISLSLPPGNDITFELTVSMGGTGLITSYAGTATSDITTGNTTINIAMGIASTKILVPDALNNRIAQMDDISGTGWQTIKGSQIPAFGGLDNNLYPNDVAIGPDGAFYVANGVTGTYNGIYRFISITDTIPIQILSVADTQADGMKAVTIDTKNERVYGVFRPYLSSTDVVYYNDFTGSLGTAGTGVQFSFTASAIQDINGIYVDESGNVFIGGQDASNNSVIYKYSSAGGSPMASYVGTTPSPVRDIVVLDNILYAAINQSGTYARIESFDPDTLIHTSPSFSFGSFNATATLNGEFAGPDKFLATFNNRLTVTDYDGGGSTSRIVSFQDLEGTGWSAIGSFGTGINQFIFVAAF